MRDKSLLQTIKLDISRSFRLIPYERIAFHSILGLLRSDNGRDILLKELERGPDIRRSALPVLCLFRDSEVLNVFSELLNGQITGEEILHILDYMGRYGTPECIPAIMKFIDREDIQDSASIERAYSVLSTIGTGTEGVPGYLMNIISSDRPSPHRALAVQALSPFRLIPTYEELLRGGDEEVQHAVYRGLYELNRSLAVEQKAARDEDAYLYTYQPDSEEKIVLDIRVLLGKMTVHFDSYSPRVKTAFIAAMMTCNHREFLIYAMKGLTAGGEQVYDTLHVIYENIVFQRDPDKLFRNLIALSTERKEEDDLIVSTFTRYFTTAPATRQFNVLKDKMYNYVVVTLETFFETYRRDFMITEVAERAYPENFQRIRNFILRRLTPEGRRQVMAFLRREEDTSVPLLLNELSATVTCIDEREKGDLRALVEILFDSDPKSRENSAARLEDINFEKRYLRSRFIRLCRIIGELGINSAASPLVNIYNYLKRYPDTDIGNAVTRALSLLNYSYLLTEIEIMLSAGATPDQMEALELVSLFTEARSLNILYEFLLARLQDTSPVFVRALDILINREIAGNGSVNNLLKKIIESTSSPEIRGMAALGLGRCGMEGDPAYLNGLFTGTAMETPRDVIVRATAEIISRSKDINKREILRDLHEYLKDPGIQVRIYACLLLVYLGYGDALKSIQDMLVIRNKAIQRDILTILGNLRSLEFSFFLISLLKEEYGIIHDVMSVLAKLPQEDLIEVDGFIVNIFRKFETPDMEDLTPKAPLPMVLDKARDEEKTILYAELLSGPEQLFTEHVAHQITVNLMARDIFLTSIKDNGGTVSLFTGKSLAAYFPDAAMAVDAGFQITQKIAGYNRLRNPEAAIRIFLKLRTAQVRLLQDEMIYPNTLFTTPLGYEPLVNHLVTDTATMSRVMTSYSFRHVPDIVMSSDWIWKDLFILENRSNFLIESEIIIRSIMEEEEKKKQLQKQVEEEVRRLRTSKKTLSSAGMARQLETLGERLEKELDELEKYVSRRSTDRELIRNVRASVKNIQNLYKVEISRFIIE